MKKGILLIAVLGMFNVVAVQAQNSMADRLEFAPKSAIFGPREFSLDLFGGYATRDKGGADNDAAGPGIGINYFFTENFGIGADTYSDAFEPPYLLNASGIFRYPVGGSGFAPYGFAGFGRQWDHAAQWLGHIGAGAEYRFNAHTGFFVDARRVFAGNTSDFALWRFGFRIAF